MNFLRLDDVKCLLTYVLLVSAPLCLSDNSSRFGTLSIFVSSCCLSSLPLFLSLLLCILKEDAARSISMWFYLAAVCGFFFFFISGSFFFLTSRRDLTVYPTCGQCLLFFFFTLCSKKANQTQTQRKGTLGFLPECEDISSSSSRPTDLSLLLVHFCPLLVSVAVSWLVLTDKQPCSSGPHSVRGSHCFP